MRLTKNQLIGLIIVLFGISIFLQNSGLGDALFWPLAFLFAGYFLHKYSRRWLGSVMYIFAGFLFAERHLQHYIQPVRLFLCRFLNLCGVPAGDKSAGI